MDDTFVNLVMRATELVQQAEQLAPLSVRIQAHLVLLELTTLMVMIAQQARVEELPS